MKRILIVDDQREIRELLSKLFILNGHGVETVEDGEAAMRLVKERQYDLVVADFGVSQMDSLDTFDGAKPRFLNRGKKAPLSINPEHTPGFRPGSRRVDFIRRLKQYNPSLAILIMSGSGVGEAFFREAGADAFLTKPLDLSYVKILVDEILFKK